MDFYGRAAAEANFRAPILELFYTHQACYLCVPLRSNGSSVRVLRWFLELWQLAHWRGRTLRPLLVVFGLVHTSPFVHVRDPFGVRHRIKRAAVDLIPREAPWALAAVT